MTITPLPDPILPPTIPYPGAGTYHPVSTTVPFTVRSASSYQDWLTQLEVYIRTVVVPHIDAETASIVLSFKTQIEALIDTVNTDLNSQATAVNTALTTQQAHVDAELAALTLFVNNAVASIINSTITVSDPVMHGVAIAELTFMAYMRSVLVQKDELAVNAYDHGLRTTNTGAQNAAAMIAARDVAFPIRGTVTVPPGTYEIDNLIWDKGLVELKALSESTATYYATTPYVSAVVFKAPLNSVNPVLTLKAPGLGLSGIRVDGNARTATASGLIVASGNEVRMHQVNVSNFNGVGLEIQSGNNTLFKDVFVMNCGANDGTNSTKPSVRVNPVSSVNGGPTINSFGIDYLNIEYSHGVSLEIGASAVDWPNVPEFLWFGHLHIEATTTGPNGDGTVNSNWPIISIGNCRNVVFDQPFIYGGPFLLIDVTRTSTLSYSHAFRDVQILGGWIKGRDVGTGMQPTNLIHLGKGDAFAIVGTELSSCSGDAIVIDAIFGPDFASSARGYNIGGKLIADARGTAQTVTQEILMRKFGALTPNTQTPTAFGGVGVYPGINASGIPVIEWDTANQSWYVGINTSSNRFVRGLTATLEGDSIDKQGNHFVTGGVSWAVTGKTTDFVIPARGVAGGGVGTVFATAGITVTMPPASDSKTLGAIIVVKNTSTAGNVTIATLGELIESAVTYVLAFKKAVTLQSNGTNWVIIGGF